MNDVCGSLSMSRRELIMHERHGERHGNDDG